MRIKHFLPCAITAAALVLTGCSSGLPDSVDTRGLNVDEKAVVTVWYDVVSGSDKKRIEKMTAGEIRAVVTAFSQLCLVDEDQAADHLASGSEGISNGDAARLADAIDDHLCEKGHKQKKRYRSARAPHHPVAHNQVHDLAKPSAWPDREAATLNVLGPGVPVWSHSGLKKLAEDPATKNRPRSGRPAAPKPAVPAPAPKPAAPAVRAPSVGRR